MRKRVGFGSQYTKCYLKRHGNLESGAGRPHLAGRKGRMEADSSRSDQSEESRGSCSEGLGSRSCGQSLPEASGSSSSLEDLATDERTTWQASQIRTSSHQLIHSTNLIKPRVTYGILNSAKSSEHDFILLSRDDDQMALYKSEGEAEQAEVDEEMVLEEETSRFEVAVQ